MHWLSTKRNLVIFLLPAILIYILYIIIPIFITFSYSFTDFNGIGSPDFIGFSNYARLLSDKLFFIAIKNTSIIILMALLILLPLSFLLGLMLSNGIRGITVVKALVFAPNVIAPIIIGVIWTYILDPNIGVINNVLISIGLENFTHIWIGGKTLTPYSIGVVYIWRVIGFNATIFLAGLQMIPREIFEASNIDGASGTQRLFHIVIPMLKETFIINIVLILTNALKIFELVVQMTGGGPNNLSHVLNTYMYYRTFTTNEYGYGMSVAVFILIVSSIISIAYIQNSRKKISY